MLCAGSEVESRDPGVAPPCSLSRKCILQTYREAISI